MATRRWTCVGRWRPRLERAPAELLPTRLRLWWVAASGPDRLLERPYKIAATHLPRAGDAIDLGLETMFSWEFVVDYVEWGNEGEITIWLCDLVEEDVFAEIGFKEATRRAHAGQFLALLRAYGFV